jgi:LiaI-LiaF-like transmembrane region
MRSTIVWGGVLVVLGGLFLLDNLGLLPVRAWAIFWPLLLIVLGAWTLFGVLRRGKSPTTSSAEVALQGAGRARVRIQHGAGILRVHGGATPGMLANGTFAGGVTRQARLEGDLLELTLKPELDVFPIFIPTHWGPGGAYDWDVALTDAVPLELSFDTGASENRLDLSSLRLSGLTLKTGASATSLTLPQHPIGTCAVRIEGGAASIEVRVPDGTEAHVRTESGLADTHVDRTRFTKVPGGYQTAGYAGASDRLEIKASLGLGAFRLS